MSINYVRRGESKVFFFVAEKMFVHKAIRHWKTYDIAAKLWIQSTFDWFRAFGPFTKVQLSSRKE